MTQKDATELWRVSKQDPYSSCLFFIPLFFSFSCPMGLHFFRPSTYSLTHSIGTYNE